MSTRRVAVDEKTVVRNERIMAQMREINGLRERAEQAEAQLAAVTRERDEAMGCLMDALTAVAAEKIGVAIDDRALGLRIKSLIDKRVLAEGGKR